MKRALGDWLMMLILICGLPADHAGQIRTFAGPVAEEDSSAEERDAQIYRAGAPKRIRELRNQPWPQASTHKLPDSRPEPSNLSPHHIPAPPFAPHRVLQVLRI